MTLDAVKIAGIRRYAVIRTWIREHLPIGFSLVRLDVLVHLYDTHPRSAFVKQLNSVIGAHPRTIRSALEDLMKDGFVEEHRLADDSRYRLYRLTAHGVAKMNEYAQVVSEPASQLAQRREKPAVVARDNQDEKQRSD